MPDRWPHQETAFRETTAAIEAGVPSICVTTPTGGGKTREMCDVMEWGLERDKRSVLYTPRKMLTEQTARVLRDEGFPFGIRAAGFDDEQRLTMPIQISSPQTEAARVYKREAWTLHDAQLALFDEGHIQKGDTAQKLLRDHGEKGATSILYTATPIGISDLCEKLIVAGVNSELRKCGAHLPCYVYAPDEPDTRNIKRQKTGEFSYADLIREVWTPVIFGRVIDNMKRLNPHRKPTLLFAPGVAESLWFAQKFEEAGYPAAHIDGEDVYFEGETKRSTREERDNIIDGIRAGEVIGCNRFVMREGIDIPELYHLILATPIGSLKSYIQCVGRVLRYHPSLDHVIVQDHGGNWWRHGSPNADRDWESLWTLPEHAASELRLERIREKKEREPICCPDCGAVRLHGDTCATCGHRHTKKVRMVIQKDGTLRAVEGDIVKQRRVAKRHDTEDLWRKMYYRMRNADRTFRQAEGFFFYENHYYPPRDLPLMPTNETDWFRSVKDVPRERLTA